jgi:3-hexulose-6-phosphate synthase/6-phospho-3-hexuloisomerase
MPKRGAPLVVLGAPLVIDADSFRAAETDLVAILRNIVHRIKES